MGLNDTIQRVHPEIIQLSSISGVFAGGEFSILLMTSGQVYSFGDNFNGQLGLGDNVNRLLPTLIPNINGISRVSAGVFHTLLLTSNGQVYSFGDNEYGQLGLNDTTDRNTPTLIPNIDTISSISAGGYHSLLLTSKTQVIAFGSNQFGQLGLGSSGQIVTGPVTIPSLSGIKQISSGQYSSTSLKLVYCFGKESHELTACSSQTRGKCIFENVCQCNEGYTGNECQMNLCFGKNETDSNVCNSKGKCIDKNTCECINGYRGQECQNQNLDTFVIIFFSVLGFCLVLFVVLIFLVILGYFIRSKLNSTKKYTIQGIDSEIDVQLLKNGQNFDEKKDSL